MKVLFVNAINPNIEQEKRYPSLGIGYLVGYLRKQFGDNYFQFKVIDRNMESHLRSFEPAIVCISATSQNINIAYKYAQMAKLRGFPVIIGGSHISALPQTLSKSIDVGVIGEGEETLTEIFRLYIEKNNLRPDELGKIHGLVYWNNGELCFTDERKPINPLDVIPFPARDLFKEEKHVHIISSRGCPYKCVFCSSAHFWGGVRYFSAEYVVEEIKSLVFKHKVKLITFYDELMMANLKRLRRIVELLNENNILGKVKFTTTARANLINEEVVMLFKRMNVVSVSMGLESGVEHVLHYLKGNNVNLLDAANAIRLLKSNNIAVSASFIIGSPDETEEEMLKTLSFIKANKIDLIDSYVLTPFPGTPIWDYAKKRGLVSENMDWGKINQNYFASHKEGVLLSNKISSEKLHRIYLRFRRAGLWLNIRNIFRSPIIIDIPKMAVNKAWEVCSKYFIKGYMA